MSKMWKDMTPEEKGALLLAHHEGKVIEQRVSSPPTWKVIPKPFWRDNSIYRVKPEPKVKTITIYTGWPEGWGWSQDHDEDDTHKITFNMIDFEPDLKSIKMEKL